MVAFGGGRVWRYKTEWEFVPFEGITSRQLAITLGQSRKLLRKPAAPLFSPLEPNSDYPDEDDFITLDGTTFVRVRYQDNAVRDIEFLSGQLRAQHIRPARRSRLMVWYPA